MVAVQLQEAENPGSIPATFTKPSGLVAQFCNRASGGQGYLDGAGHLSLNTWLDLDLSVTLLILLNTAELDLRKRSGS